MNTQSIINKLVLAFKQKEKIIKISVEENYSLKFKKIFKKYKLQETTETEIELKQKYYKLKKEYNDKGKPPSMKDELEKLKFDLSQMKVPVIEFSNKIEIIKYLADRYKKICEEMVT